MPSETRYEKSARMGGKMADIIRDKGSCTDDDLRAADFSDAEIRLHRAAAHAHAAVILKSPRNAP